jgi:hypothetical protein
MCFFKRSRVQTLPLFHPKRTEVETVEDLSQLSSTSDSYIPFLIPPFPEPSSLFSTQKHSSLTELLSQMMANSSNMMKLQQVIRSLLRNATYPRPSLMMP